MIPKPRAQSLLYLPLVSLARMHRSPAPSLNSASHALELHQVRLQRGATTVFQQFSLRLTESRIGLIGDNGAGKTSLLRLLCGLETPDAGHVELQGEDLAHMGATRTQSVGMMFQNPDDQIIFPTVLEELALGLQPQGLSKKQAQACALTFLTQRGLANWAPRSVASLSQGQRQHVCWLALLLAAPHTLLLDEPYASLDLLQQAHLARDIAQAPHQIVVSTHLLEHVRNFERVLWMEKGQIRADGPGSEVCSAYEANILARLGTPTVASPAEVRRG